MYSATFGNNDTFYLSFFYWLIMTARMSYRFRSVRVCIRAYIRICLVVLLCSMAMMSDLEAQIVVVRERATVIAAGSLTDIVRTGEAFEITLRNTGSQDVAVKGVVTFSTGSTVLLQTNTTEAPAFTIRAGETRIFLAHHFLREGAIAGASFAENPIFPFTSTYQVCYSIVSSNGAQTLVSQRCIPVNARPPINENNLRSQVRRIMGFAVEWGTITLTPSGFQASGRLTVPSNSLFTVPAGRTVNFINATIPYSALDNDAIDIEPQGGELTLVESSFTVNYQNWVPVTLTNVGGLRIRRDQTLPEVNGLRPGSIRARVLLNIDSYLRSYNVNNSALSDTVELGLAQGEVLSGRGNRLIPAVVASGNPSIASPLVVTNQDSLTWRLYGFTFGAISPVTVRATPDTLVMTGTVSMTVPNSELTRVNIGFRFHRTGNVFTSRVNIPDTTRIGSWRSSARGVSDRSVVRIAFGDGQITGSGFQFPGRVIVNARGFTTPLQFTLRRFTIAYSATDGWSVGNTELELQSNANGKIGMESRGRWFAFQEIEDKATGRTTNYTVEGEGFLTVGLPLGLKLSLPTKLAVDTTGNITAEIQTKFSFKFPAKKGGDPDKSPVSIEVNSITYGSANALVAIDGGLELSLPKGVTAALKNLAFDNTGLRRLGGELGCEFGPNFEGKIGVEFSNLNDTLVWSGLGEIAITAGQVKIGMGVEFRYADQNDFKFGMKVSRIPGISLSVSPPTWLEQVSGSIAFKNQRWDVGIGTLITVFSPRDELNGKPGMNLDVTGNLRFGGVGGVEFEIAGKVTARGYGLSQELGQGSLKINFTNRTLDGTIAMNATLLGAVTATADVNLNIDFPKGKFLIDATTAYNVLGLARANGRFLFKRDSAETRLFVDWNQTLIDLSGGFNAVIYVNYGANVRYGFTLDINTVSVGGNFRFYGSAYFEGGVDVWLYSKSFARISATVDVRGAFSYVFSSKQLSLDLSGIVQMSGGIGDRCGCNDWCRWGVTGCIDLRARAGYTTARGFTYSFNR
jgi:hypothetical protein